MRFLVLFLGTIVLLSSCVTNKKIVYLQKNDVNVKDLPKDTVVREYTVEDFRYGIQSNDVIAIQFRSLSPKEYDFFSSGSTQQSSSTNLTGANALMMGELVDENGEIPFPVVGKIKVAGLTIFEVQDTLQKIANQYLESPIVKARLLNYRVTLLGELVREGTVTLTNNRTTLIEAIGLSGGLTDLADRTNIKLIRQREGKTEIAYINILEENFFESPFYYVYQNDVLIVPALRQRSFRKYFGQNIALVVSTLSLLLLTINLSK